MSDPPVAQQLPAPEQQAQTAAYPLAGSLTIGVEYTFTSAAGYGFTAVYNKTLPDGCLDVKTKDGIDGFVNPTEHRRRCARRRVGPGVTSGPVW